MAQKTYIARYTLPNIFRIGPVRFVPGLNYVTEDQWNEIKAHPLLPYRFKNGHIEWMKGKGPADYVAPNKPEKSEGEDDGEGEATGGDEGGAGDGVSDNVLASFNTKESIALIKETLDLNVLEAWKKKEGRKGVIAAIDEQIEEITTGHESGEDAED